MQVLARRCIRIEAQSAHDLARRASPGRLTASAARTIATQWCRNARAAVWRRVEVARRRRSARSLENLAARCCRQPPPLRQRPTQLCRICKMLLGGVPHARNGALCAALSMAQGGSESQNLQVQNFKHETAAAAPQPLSCSTTVLKGGAPSVRRREKARRNEKAAASKAVVCPSEREADKQSAADRPTGCEAAGALSHEGAEGFPRCRW